ncbi:hypothetical protein TRIUR3_24591 [Triticum urartu]|uniref:SOSEKI DIX-like domain-containing protein n=1 Tax=Triticum urartu TaxID=4572 RepID=M7ZZQ9_TRIUA|nr:hypothetical protein TRIUR3_24591 [Triticum urartu]
MRRVQIIYYLCRSGQLEHPHFMELAQFPPQPLRLKDVMDKLTLLRGKGMPALFSWSCKRNYKNGYVWNDLSESDVIYPSDGVEYVLKGSEIFPGCSSGERFQHLRVTDSGGRGTPLPASSLKRSNSYTEERGSRLGAGVIGEGTADGRIGGEEGMMRGRCIPGRKRQPQHQK